MEQTTKEETEMKEQIKEETQETPSNLLSPKGAIVFSEQLFPVLQISAAPPPINEVNPPSFFNIPPRKPTSELPQPQPISKRKQTKTPKNNTITNREVAPIANNHNHTKKSTNRN